jgi:SpoVK/Ycf46/Vps4 family AAA+-type ATPase
LNDKIQFICPPVFDLDTNVMFFRVEELENTTQETFQGLLVSEETELLQSSPISARAPGEDIVKRFVSFFNGSKHLASIDSMYSDSKAARQLEEMLLPSQLCNLVVSVLISGPRGVGKTTLVYQVAKHLGVFVVEVAFTELTAQSELHLLENMKDQVVKAQAVSPCILYISHLFAVEKNNEESELRISAALMECMQVLGSRGIPLIACVEDVNEIPKFLRQCFLYELPIEAPNQASRKAFLEQSTIATRLDSQVDLAEIAQLTAGRTYGELSSLVRMICCSIIAQLTDSNGLVNM